MFSLFIGRFWKMQWHCTSVSSVRIGPPEFKWALLASSVWILWFRWDDQTADNDGVVDCSVQIDEWPICCVLPFAQAAEKTRWNPTLYFSIQIVNVVECSNNDWWHILRPNAQKGHGEGFVPANRLRLIEAPEAGSPAQSKDALKAVQREVTRGFSIRRDPSGIHRQCFLMHLYYHYKDIVCVTFKLKSMYWPDAQCMSFYKLSSRCDHKPMSVAHISKSEFASFRPIVFG